MPFSAPSSAQVDSIVKWTQIAANLAAALMLLVAGYQFYGTVKAQRLQSSLAVLTEGLDLDRKYQDGKAVPRDVFAFYYRVYVSRESGGVNAEIVGPLERSLCTAVIDNPGVADYWDKMPKEEKSYFVPTFVDHVNKIRSKKTCE
jgi:hypothetical protein